MDNTDSTEGSLREEGGREGEGGEWEDGEREGEGGGWEDGGKGESYSLY